MLRVYAQVLSMKQMMDKSIKKMDQLLCLLEDLELTMQKILIYKNIDLIYFICLQQMVTIVMVQELNYLKKLVLMWLIWNMFKYILQD
jgi:transposase